MQLKHVALLLSITLTPALSVKLTANSLNSLFQGIMSPKSTEQTLQALTLGTNKKVEPAVTRRFAVLNKLPRTVITKEPRKIIALVSNPKEIALKNVLQNPNNVMVQKKPKTVVIQHKMDTVTPKNVIGETQIVRNVLLRNDEVPKRVIVHKRLPETKKEVQQKVLIAQPKGTELKVPQKKVVVQSGNPYLPAASPVSPLLSALPTAMPQSRGQFLRKIPMPPPTM